ncbi:hypothetical protein ACVI1L_000890 [Bradyrhizobium sp. USDA 4516]
MQKKKQALAKPLAIKLYFAHYRKLGFNLARVLIQPPTFDELRFFFRQPPFSFDCREFNLP